MLANPRMLRDAASLLCAHPVSRSAPCPRSETSNTMFHLAQVRWQQGEGRQAIQLMQDSLEIMEAQVCAVWAVCAVWCAVCACSVCEYHSVIVFVLGVRLSMCGG